MGSVSGIGGGVGNQAISSAPSLLAIAELVEQILCFLPAASACAFLSTNKDLKNTHKCTYVSQVMIKDLKAYAGQEDLSLPRQLRDLWTRYVAFYADNWKKEEQEHLAITVEQLAQYAVQDTRFSLVLYHQIPQRTENTLEFEPFAIQCSDIVLPMRAVTPDPILGFSSFVCRTLNGGCVFSERTDTFSDHPSICGRESFYKSFTEEALAGCEQRLEDLREIDSLPLDMHDVQCFPFRGEVSFFHQNLHQDFKDSMRTWYYFMQYVTNSPFLNRDFVGQISFFNVYNGVEPIVTHKGILHASEGGVHFFDFKTKESRSISENGS